MGVGIADARRLPALVFGAFIGLVFSCVASAQAFVPTGDDYVLASGTAVTRARPDMAFRQAAQLTDSELAEQLAAYLRLARAEQDLSYIGFGLSLLSRLEPIRRTNAEIALAEGDLLQHAHRFPAALEAYRLAAVDPVFVVQAELRRFVLLMMVGHFGEARKSCAVLQARAALGYGLACKTWLAGLTRDTDVAIAELRALLPLMSDQPAVAGWMREIVLDLLLLNGEIDAALAMLDSGVLDVADTSQNIASPALPVEIVKFTVEHLILAGRYTAARQLLDRAEDARPLSVHRQLLQQLLGRKAAGRKDTEALIAGYLRTEQLDKYKLVALWQLLAESDAPAALAAAKQSWQTNRYISDALLLQQLARTVGDMETLAELRRWRQAHSIRSALLGEV